VEVDAREVLVFLPLLALIFWIGLYPSPLLRRSEASVRAVVQRVERRAQGELWVHPVIASAPGATAAGILPAEAR